MAEPEFVYHASTNHEIEIFEPRDEKTRDLNEGPVIFAAPDKVTASLFAVPTDDSWVASGYHNDVPYIAISDKKRFIKADRGGTMYYLPGHTFSCNPEIGMGEKEWTSKTSVKPLKKERYDSGLSLMLDQGVQVYFVDKQAWEKIQSSKDHGLAVLDNELSENQRLGINPKSLYGVEE